MGDADLSIRFSEGWQCPRCYRWIDGKRFDAAGRAACDREDCGAPVDRRADAVVQISRDNWRHGGHEGVAAIVDAEGRAWCTHCWEATAVDGLVRSIAEAWVIPPWLEYPGAVLLVVGASAGAGALTGAITSEFWSGFWFGAIPTALVCTYSMTRPMHQQLTRTKRAFARQLLARLQPATGKRPRA